MAPIFPGKTFENCWKTDLNSTEGNHWEQANPLPTAVAFAGNFALLGGYGYWRSDRGERINKLLELVTHSFRNGGYK